MERPLKIAFFQSWRFALLLFGVGFLLCVSPPGSAYAAAPVLKVLDGGNGPKRVLRFAPRVGDQQSMSLNWRVDMDMDMGGMQVPMNIPPVVMLFRTEVKEVKGSGEITYELVLVSVEVQPQDEASHPAAALMKDEMKKIEGMKGTVVMSSSGFVREKTFKRPAGMDEGLFTEVTNAVDSAGTQYPDSAVGKGARWSVTDHVTERGIHLKRTTRYLLRSIEGEQVDLEISSDAEPTQMRVDSPDLPPGATAELSTFKADGKGETQARLDRILPVSSTLQMVVNSTLAVSVEGQKMDMSTSLKVHFSLQGR